MKKVVGEILRPFAIIRTICTLAGLTIGTFGENYEQDKNGRSVKITQMLGGHELEPGTIPMFMFENLQGTNENIAIGDQINKHPKEYTGSTPADLQSFLDGNNGNKYYIIQKSSGFSTI